MSQDSPIARLLIQKVYIINEKILQRTVEYEPTQQELNVHLKKAQDLGSARYQAETLNALGNLERVTYRDPVPYWERALELAEPLGDVDLRLKLYNNLGSTYGTRWQFQRSIPLLQRGVVVAQELKLRTVAALYLHTNLMDSLLNSGDFEGAHQTLGPAWVIAKNAELMQYTAFVYGQIMFGLYQYSAKVRMMYDEEETALLNLRLALEIGEQLEHDTYLVTANIGLATYYQLCEQNPMTASSYEAAAERAAQTVPQAHDWLRASVYLLHNDAREAAHDYAKRAHAAALDEEDGTVADIAEQVIAGVKPQDLSFPA